MFCPKCGNHLERSYKFCPECGFILSGLTKTNTQNVTTSAPQSSVTTEAKTQEEAQDHVLKDFKEQENTQQLVSGNLESARDDAATQDTSNNTTSSATVETRTTVSPLSETHDDLVAGPPAPGTCEVEERPSSETILSASMTPPFPTSQSDILTELQTEDSLGVCAESRPDAVEGPADKTSNMSSCSVVKASSSSTSTKDTSSTAPELSEQTPQESDLVTNPSASQPRPETKKTSKITERQEQQPGYKDVHGSRSQASSHPPTLNEGELGPLEAANILLRSNELPQMSSVSEMVTMYFHAVTSKDFKLDPKKDFVSLQSEVLFGTWDNGVKMSFSRSLGDKRHLVEVRIVVHKNMTDTTIPYKYVIFKKKENTYKCIYETIYQEQKNPCINRCLSVKHDFLTHEGEWHQYDDMIHLNLSNSWFWKNAKNTVVEGRNEAGKEMLEIIFDLLTTWNEQNVKNFFFLLQQFFYTYSSPLIHDGMARPWGLPYGEKQVKALLKGFLEEKINPNTDKGKAKSFLTSLHAGVVGLWVYNEYLNKSMSQQLSMGLCDLLCLPNKPQDDFVPFWEDFVRPIADRKSVADAVEMLCRNARHNNNEKWFLLLPLIHLLRGESKPFEPAPPLLNPQFDLWTSSKGNKGTHSYWGSGDRNQIGIMKEHAYLVNIDHRLAHSWMSLLSTDDLLSFISSVEVDLLDILHCMQFTAKSGVTNSLDKLALYFIKRLRTHNKSFDDSYGECCLITAVRLLGSVCSHVKDPNRCDVPLHFLELVCLIAERYGHNNSESRVRVHKETFWETLETVRKWQQNTFKSKLFNERTQHFYDDCEIEVWKKLFSLSFSHEEDTDSWRETLMEDFKSKLKKESKMDQIGIYSNKVEELQDTSPLLCSTMEKCALEAVEVLCKDKSGRAVSDLLTKHDISKFGKLMSVVVLNTWPTNANGDDTDEEEDLIFEFLVKWPMAKTVFNMTDASGRHFDKLSDQAQKRVALASSIFKSVSVKFLSGDIQIKTLDQILKNEQKFIDLLKIDGLCDDGRCKDDKTMNNLLSLRKMEVEAVHREKEMVNSLIEICQEIPQHVRVDFEGLDKRLHQNIEGMNLNDLMRVHTLDGQDSFATENVNYFNLSDVTCQMASKLHAIKDSLIFKMCWWNQVELSNNHPEDLVESEQIYTLDDVYSNIFQSCYSKYEELYRGLKSAKALLKDIDSMVEVHKGSYDDLQKDLETMCRINPRDDRTWIRGRVNQIQHYHELHLAIESAKVIMNLSNIICPDGDFKVLEKLLQLNQNDFKNNTLDYIDNTLIEAKKILEDITDDRRECLQELNLRTNFVKWVEKELKDINELKVFVDLASISAGENDLDVDRVACFHDAVLGYSSILYGLKQNSNFEDFMTAASKLWAALQNDKKLPEKLRDTSRHLEWLNNVKESHGSVEFSSLSLATSINERGTYTIKAQNQKKVALESSLTLEIQEEKSDMRQEKNLTCTYEALTELQNKLMLMSGRGNKNHNEVKYFTEVFDKVQRLAKAFIDLYAAGNPLFRCWEAKIYCKTQTDPCIIMEINFCNTQHCIQVCGSLVEQLTALSKKMELFLVDWQNFIDQQRRDHYYLNYFTAEQIFYLCSVVTQTNANVNAEIEENALMMLSFIKPNCTTADVWAAWRRFCSQFQPGKRADEFIHFQSIFLHQDDSSMSLAEPADKVNHQTVGLKELEELWKDYMKNKGTFFRDLLDLRSLGGLLKLMTDTGNQDESEWDEPMLSDTKDISLRRKLPKGLFPNQPNLIICAHNKVLTSSISLYMTDDYEPLPSYDEVLLCTPTTSHEQVELFLRRCLTPGDMGQKIYTMLWADQLSYNVSCALEKCFKKMDSLFKHKYNLVIFCSSDREHTYIPTAFSQFKRDFVPQEPLERIQKYLSRHYTVTSDHKDALFKGSHYVGIVASRRAGVGKSLYVQRLYEKLVKGVDPKTIFKKCIRLTDREVDDQKVLQSLYDTPKQKDLKVFHFDVTSSVQKGLNEFLFKLFFLRYLMDSDGQMWHCSCKHLYLIELLESNNCQPSSGQKENLAFSDIFPKVFCHTPKEVLDLKQKREENTDMDSDDPLMDDECFRSEAYQRPYQYLTRYSKKENLDKFTYRGIEGTHEECLQIFLDHCGLPDPSWTELRNFVWFLNHQLQDCENSAFCKHELVGDTLRGFKTFVVKFMILMSKDFATPSLCSTDQSPGTQQTDSGGDIAPFLIRKRWESEPHPYIFFNDDGVSMTFIGFHLKLNGQRGVDAMNHLTGEVIEANIMTRELYNCLVVQRVPFNRDFDQLPRADKIELLCNVLGISGSTDPDEMYELTTDNILKMMAIHMRFKCGIPVIIMGETGCGKTRLIKFMCELRRCGAPAENMKLVKVHGGTTSEMIHEKVKEAVTLAKTNKKDHKFDSVLFFDEANTTEAISSIKEILCDNTVQGEQLGSKTGLQIIAACNPYRKHTDKMIERLEASGLGYRVRAEETEEKLGSIPLRQLVYRVHVLPPSMIPLVWDFGQLNETTEKIYIEQIVQRQVKANSIDVAHIKTITTVMSSSQKLMRERRDECSFVSLRDVERCMQVLVWFHRNHSMFAEELKTFLQEQSQKKKNTSKPSLSPAEDRVIWSLLMATGVCYQSCLEDKRSYLTNISNLLPPEYNEERILWEIKLIQDLLLHGVPMGETIARNEALKENFFMMVICVELRIPLFIVGKPGSSKSLSKTLVADAMQGPASHTDLYKKLKQIHLVSFQCSPHSTPEGIINTFKQCARFQENQNLDEYISVVVLDEIGLAEDSPKMPLKTLHPLLEEGCVDDEPQPHKRVGFIGISNWALDPAKMNRGIFVTRGDPDQNDLIKSAKGICASDKKVLEKVRHLFEPFAKAYVKVCMEGKGFFGLRDFYSLIKMVFSITKKSNQRPTTDEITGAVLRNFSGKDDMNVMAIFRKELCDSVNDCGNAKITTINMVESSISPCQEEENRYLLILTKNYAALQIVQKIFLAHKIHPEIIFGSSFPKDQEYTQICKNINRVKVCMETGQTVVLLNLQNLYESLYDALNQFYMTFGGQKYVDLGLGTHRVKCRVHKTFRLIVIEEKEVVYEQYPVPLINRLEKHYLDINTVLREEQKENAKQLQKWVNDFVSLSDQQKNCYTPSDVFIGYHSDTCSSVLLQVTETKNVETEAQTSLDKAKNILLSCATPDSVIRLDKSKLPPDEREHLTKEYVRDRMHRSLWDYIVYHKQQSGPSSFFFTEVTTFSRLLTAADMQQLQNMTKCDHIKLLSLQQFDTEYSFLEEIREFLGSKDEGKVLIIQTDYDEESHRRNILSSAKYSCINEINKWTTTDNTKTYVYFVIKLPRIKGGTSYVGFQGGIWTSVHIDDLRRSKEFVSDAHSFKNLRISDLFEDQPQAAAAEQIDTDVMVKSCVQGAVSMLRDAKDSGELSTKRIENLLTLLDRNHTQGDFANIVRKRLHLLLEEYEASISNPRSWVLREASNVTALQEGGTFLHTLWRKIQAVVTSLLANLISVIDRDCNLDLCIDGGDDVRNLWLEIFRSKDMLRVPFVEAESKVLLVQSHTTGDNTMRCHMPFSWWIKDFLDELMMQTSRHESHSPGHFQKLFLKTPLGSYMVNNVNEKVRKEFFERYLTDFISLTMKVASDEELQLLRQALASCVDEIQKKKNDEGELMLPHIHIAYHSYQSRLQNLSWMISVQPEIVLALQRNQHIGCPEMVLDVYAAKACIEYLGSPDFNTDALCRRWLRQVKRLQASVELICSQQKIKQYGNRCKEILQDVSNGWKHIYILSLFVEHMLLGFHDEEIQLRQLVQSYTQILSKVLEGNSDVTTPRGFEAVIKELKSCKQTASDQIFRLRCGVCLKDSQDPVRLTCHHIYCLTCIVACLHAGRTSCPLCREQLPNDFKPHVTENMRESLRKNAEFKRRCDGFFIDMITSVCFKDNTPPASGVITHLLSYMKVETGTTEDDKQIHTKDMSPFDESPDDNPVVRSVILKLLLKFSFNEIKGYLEQHLSSVEESGFVDKSDKTELYALYINCMEDSLWEKMPVEDNLAKEMRTFFSVETQFLEVFLAKVTSAPTTVSFEYLQHVARLRLSLTMATKLISDSLSGNNVPDGAEDFLKAVTKLCEESKNDWYRVYLIRKLSERCGVELIQTLVKQAEFSWLFPTEILQQNEVGGQMDQYLVYGEEYQVVRDAVAKAAVGGDVEQIEEVCEKCTAPPRNRALFILLALFREVTTLYRSENTRLHPTPEQCQAFGEFIQGSEYLHQKEVRDFASALVHNRLGALTIHPGNTVEDNAVTEMTIHLAVGLLTGTHPLLMPLKQLGLSPENMQRAFIPTMPDDMLAVAQAAIRQTNGQLTWYVCPNNHPCFVDACGRPTQRGRCLECGEEVGGERHVPLPGFEPIQLQDDNTRPGHILGDPEQRNISDAPDTKNMSLTPFTLVRLVTHLAMLLGASASEKVQFVQNIIQPRVEDVHKFLMQHIRKDLDHLSQALGKGTDDTLTTVHLVLKFIQNQLKASHSVTDPPLTTKESRNYWETTVATEIMTQLKDLEQLLQQGKSNIRTDSRISSNLLIKITSGDDCTFLTSLPRGSQVHSSAVWSCRERLSLLHLTHTMETNDQKEALPLLWRFLQKEREYRQIKFLPDILILQKHLVRRFQNASDQIVGSVREFIEKQTEPRRTWYEKHIDIFLKTWNLLRGSVTSSEMKIPDEFSSKDLDLNSELQYLLPRRQGRGLCAAALVRYLVTLQNELMYAVDRHIGEDSSSYKVSLAELAEQHVICYEVDKDLLPLVLSNCQYSLERGHETVSHYDLSKIQQQILTHFLQGKPFISCTGIPTLVNTQERAYEIIFKAVKEKVPQALISSMRRNALSRSLDCHEVCEAFRIVELLLGFLSVTGGNPMIEVVSYLKDVLKMADNIDHHILQALHRFTLNHCVSLWQLLSSLKSEHMLRLRMEPFLDYPDEYKTPLTEQDMNELKDFMSGRKVDQWLLEMHEFILLNLDRPRAIDDFNPVWSVKETVAAYMDRKEVEVPPYVEKEFPDLQLSKIVETWKYTITIKQALVMEG